MTEGIIDGTIALTPGAALQPPQLDRSAYIAYIAENIKERMLMGVPPTAAIPQSYAVVSNFARVRSGGGHASIMGHCFVRWEASLFG